jgi:hypothetical protein
MILIGVKSSLNRQWASLPIIMKTRESGQDAAPQRCADPKWAASINDKVIPMPRRHVSESILRDQGGVPPDHVIVRDHNSPSDPVIEPGTEVDLSRGEVFYSVPRCEVGDRREPCSAPPKRLVVVDDRPEIVVRSEQTGNSIRELFGLKCDVDLFRDLESPNDRKVEPDEAVDLDEGNVFVTRGAVRLEDHGEQPGLPRSRRRQERDDG